jgi:two-component sensor histidine kinase
MTFLQGFMSEVPFAQDNITLDREADHRIANNLGLIVSLLRLRARAVVQHPGKMERAEVSMLLEDIATRVETVAGLHRMLSHSYRTALVDLGAYLRELCTSLTRSLSTDTQVQTSYHIEEARVLPPDQVLTVGMLVSELITNSVKYAHPTGLPVNIDVTCRSVGAGRLMIEVADDGVGLPENFDPIVDGGLGLRVVRSLAAQLGAAIQFHSDALGTRVQLQMPASVGAPQ